MNCKWNITFGIILLLCVVLIGCATVGQLSTPSGRPEVFIEKVISKDVISKFVGVLAEGGWQIERVTDYTIQAAHSTGNKDLDTWYLVMSQTRIRYRLLLTFVQESDGVRIFATQSYITNDSLRYQIERVNDLTDQKGYQNTQDILDVLKSSMFEHIKIIFKGVSITTLWEGIGASLTKGLSE